MSRPPRSICIIITLLLAVTGVLCAVTDRGLYADGGLYFLDVVTSGTFLHVSETRISATFLNQAALVLSLRLGVDSLAALARMQSLSLALVPLTAYGAALWIARRSPWLFCGTVVTISAVFYPTGFVLNGEFHILYSLYWLAFVILESGTADGFCVACVLPLLGLALMRSYEVSLLLCGILAALSLWRALTSADRAARPVLVLSAGVFLLAVWFGIQGVLHPRDTGTMHEFETALRRGTGNHPLIETATLALAACAVASLPGLRSRRAAGMGLLVLAAIFVVRRASSPSLGLGPAFDARAQVVPILLGVSCLCVLLPRLPRIDASRLPMSPWILVVPVLAVFLVDASDTFGWHRFIGSMCHELADRDLGKADPDFVDRAASQKFGWDWTYPTLSILLRPLGSTAIIADPHYHGWEPPDTITRAVARLHSNGTARYAADADRNAAATRLDRALTYQQSWLS